MQNHINKKKKDTTQRATLKHTYGRNEQQKNGAGNVCRVRGKLNGHTHTHDKDVNITFTG